MKQHPVGRPGSRSARLRHVFTKRPHGLTPAVIAGALLCSAALAYGAYSLRASTAGSAVAPAGKPTLSHDAARPRARSHSRLALQPEADRQRRRLGRRFSAPGREVSVMTGTVTLGADRRAIRIIRTLNDDTERVSVALDGGPDALAWSASDGATSGGGRAEGDLRELVERLALDSPDQFVLAQTRGASYYAVARNVRLEEAGGSDDYAGPLWDVVRVAEPAHAAQNRPQSPWRLYHINARTGLIDKIVSRERGETITAEISDWVTAGGETAPARISWKRDGRTVMELSLNAVVHAPK